MDTSDLYTKELETNELKGETKPINLEVKSGSDVGETIIEPEVNELAGESNPVDLNINTGGEIGQINEIEATDTAELITGRSVGEEINNTPIELADDIVISETDNKIDFQQYALKNVKEAEDDYDVVIKKQLDEFEPEIDDGSITTAKLADGAVTNDKLAENSVTSTEIADDSITTAKLADGAVTNDKLAENSVSSTEIADESITTAKLDDGSVTSDKIKSTVLFDSTTTSGGETQHIPLSDNPSLYSAIEVYGVETGGRQVYTKCINTAIDEKIIICAPVICNNWQAGAFFRGSVLQIKSNELTVLNSGQMGIAGDGNITFATNPSVPNTIIKKVIGYK